MNHPKDSHLDTITVAETALAQISTHGQPADPKSFELWYRFATGKSGLLCAAINSRLERSGTLTRKDIDDLYSAHVAPADSSAKVERLGARVADEIEQVTAMLAAAEGTALQYSADLVAASQRLGAAKDRDGVRAVVERLFAASKENETSNRKLQEQLQALCEEVGQLRRELER